MTGAAAPAESLSRIEAAAGRALDSLDRSIDVLGNDDHTRLRQGSPGLAGITELVTEFGRPVELSTDIPGADDIPAAVQTTAYRVVVEGLNNVRRHAPASASVAVVVALDADDLLVSVSNGARATGPARLARRRRRSGLGLAGLRERVETLGGTFTAEPAEGENGWLLSARLPIVDPVSVVPASRPTRVVIADDHEMVRHGFRMVLEAQPDMQVVAEASNGSSALDQVRSLHPDVLVSDIRMGGLDGFELTRRVVDDVALGTRVIVVTAFNDDDYVARALRYGAVGFLLKKSAATLLVAAIRAALAGDMMISPEVTVRLLQRLSAGPSRTNASTR